MYERMRSIVSAATDGSMRIKAVLYYQGENDITHYHSLSAPGDYRRYKGDLAAGDVDPTQATLRKEQENQDHAPEATHRVPPRKALLGRTPVTAFARVSPRSGPPTTLSGVDGLDGDPATSLHLVWSLIGGSRFHGRLTSARVAPVVPEMSVAGACRGVSDDRTGQDGRKRRPSQGKS